MPLHPIDESTLIDLAHGLTPHAEREAILVHLRGCGPCENRFRELVAEREMLRAESRRRIAAGRTAGPSRRARTTVWVSAAAASVLVASLLVSHLSENGRRVEYWIPVEQEATLLRSTGDAHANSIWGALDAYVNRDAPRAIEALRSLALAPENEPALVLRDLFLASALVNAGSYADADELLGRLEIDTLPTQWRRQARWVRYLALSQLDQEDEARALLEKSVREPGEIGRLARKEIHRLRQSGSPIRMNPDQ